jgi:integrase
MPVEGRKMAAIRHLKVVTPVNVKRTVVLPVRKLNTAYRSREHLTEREVEWLVEAAKDNRWGHRDATMVLLAFRHGLRAAELVDLRWEQVDLENAILQVRRVKQGTRTIQSYLGHRSIQHTVRYTELAPTRFKSLFRD